MEKKIFEEFVKDIGETNRIPSLNPSLLTIDSLQQAIKNLHRDMATLQKSYRRDSEDQWKIISELREKVEKLEESQ